MPDGSLPEHQDLATAVSEIDAIVCEISIAAHPETVFAYFTQSDLYREGWELYLNRLSKVAAGVQVGPDPNANPPRAG